MLLSRVSATEGAVHRAVCTTRSQSERLGSPEQRSSPTVSLKLRWLWLEFQGYQTFLSPSSHIRSRIMTTKHFGRRLQKLSVNAKRFCCIALLAEAVNQSVLREIHPLPLGEGRVRVSRFD